MKLAQILLLFTILPAPIGSAQTLERGAPTSAMRLVEEIKNELNSIERREEAIRTLNLLQSSGDSVHDSRARRDPIALRSRIELAERHSLLGDVDSAVKLADEAEKLLDPMDAFGLARLHRIRLEALRQRQSHVLMAKLCLTTLGNSLYSSAVDDALLASCALAYAKGTSVKLKRESTITPAQVKSFAWNGRVRRMDKYRLQTAMMMGIALHNSGMPSEALEYLAQAKNRLGREEVWNNRLDLVSALLLMSQQKTAEAIGLLRALSADGRVGSEAQNKDAQSRYLAMITLARIYAAKGQLEAAKVSYRAALDWSIHNQQPLLQHSPTLGEFADFRPAEFISVAVTKFETKKIRGELARLLFQLGRYDEAVQSFEQSFDESYDREFAVDYARSLAISPKFSALGIQDLAKLLGYGDADLTFVRMIKSNLKETKIESLMKFNSSLVAIAQSLGMSISEIERLEMIDRKFSRTPDQVRLLQSQLLQALFPVIEGRGLVMERRERELTTAAGELLHNLIGATKKIDSLSKELWSAGEKASASGERVRNAVLNRMQAYQDELSPYLDRAILSQMMPGVAALEKISDDFRASALLLTKTRVAKESLQTLLKMAKPRPPEDGETDWKVLAEESSSAVGAATQNLDEMEDRLEKQGIQLAIERLHLFAKGETARFFSSKIQLLEQTIGELQAVHLRMRRVSSSGVDAHNFEEIDATWKQMRRVAQRISKLALLADSHVSRERAMIVQEARLIQTQIDSQTRMVQSNGEKLRIELLHQLPLVAQKLEPFMISHRDSIRLAIAEGHVSRILDDERLKRDVARASEERMVWLRLVRDSLKWGLVR